MKDNNIQIIELSKYTSPEITEHAEGDFVAYGADNNYFQYLIDRYTGSTTNNAVINGIVRMIYGKGIDALDSNKKPEEYAYLRKILKPTDLRNVISDRYILGIGVFQVVYKNKKIESLIHFPMKDLRSGKADPKTGKVTTWYYHPNWAEVGPRDELKSFKVFGEGNKEKSELLFIKPYSTGSFYYPPVNYQGALPYAVLEEEIADYLINDTINGFSGTKIVNFNNGVPSPDIQRRTKTDVKRKFSGSRGDKIIVAFNKNKEAATTIEDIPLNDAPAHYQYLANEAKGKLITGHGVTSPLLLGIREEGNGLGSNADEIKNASLFFDNIVVKPFQNEFIDVLDEVLASSKGSLNLYFKTIQPLEFIETDGLDEDTKEEETGIKEQLSKENEDFNDEEMLNSLKECKIDPDWELVDSREVKDTNEPIDSWAKRLIKRKGSMLARLAGGFVKQDANGDSKLDKSYYKVRYSYRERYSSANSRRFCKTMMSRTGAGVVYRKEDIDQASFQGVNSELGHKKQNYSLFRFKGGVNCGHYWQEELYRVKSQTQKISQAEEQDSIPASYTPEGSQYQDAKIAPKDMPNSGHHPSYNK